MNNPFNITREEIIELAATKLLAEFDYSDSGIYDIATKRIAESVDKVLKERLIPQIDKHLADSIASIFNAEICPVNVWGEKIGQPKKLRDTFNDRCRDFWTQTVDREGNPDNRGYGDRVSRAEWMYKKVAAEAFSQALKQDLINVAGAMKDAVRIAAHERVNAALNEVFNVKSNGDKK